MQRPHMELQEVAYHYTRHCRLYRLYTPEYYLPSCGCGEGSSSLLLFNGTAPHDLFSTFYIPKNGILLLLIFSFDFIILN